jgi:prepilin-type N-terminal cleavage/methylation domain-containing protein
MFASNKRLHRGLTLVEVLVVLALSALAITILTRALIPALKISVSGASKVDIQQRAVLAVDSIARDLHASAAAGITLPTDGDPMVFAIHRLTAVTPRGSQEWEDSVVVYVWDKTEFTLTRKTWPPSPPSITIPSTTKPSPPGEEDLATISSTANGTEKIMLRDLKEFELQSAGDPGVIFPLTIRVKLEKQAPGEPLTFEFTRAVTLRNDAH